MRYFLKKKWKWVLLGLTSILIACSTVPITGRKQLTYIPESQMMSMSFSQYDQFLNENKISDNTEQTEMVKRVGQNMAKAVEKYLTDNGLADRIDGFQWEFNLIDDPQVNAWCMPGGKVVVYTGLLPIAKNETGLAVVMGHEIAHAVARHGSERMSQQMLVQMGGVALTTALSEKPAATQALFGTAYGMGTKVSAILPFSRKHELEADHLGLIFMAIAGYDPGKAANFWKRMSQQGGEKPPLIMSTHPSDDQRIQQINDYLDEAYTYYKK